MTSEEAAAAVAAGYEGPWVARLISTGQLITPEVQGSGDFLHWWWGGVFYSEELTDFTPLGWLPMECAPRDGQWVLLRLADGLPSTTFKVLMASWFAEDSKRRWCLLGHRWVGDDEAIGWKPIE